MLTEVRLSQPATWTLADGMGDGVGRTVRMIVPEQNSIDEPGSPMHLVLVPEAAAGLPRPLLVYTCWFLVY